MLLHSGPWPGWRSTHLQLNILWIIGCAASTYTKLRNQALLPRIKQNPIQRLRIFILQLLFGLTVAIIVFLIIILVRSIFLFSSRLLQRLIMFIALIQLLIGSRY